MEENVQHLTFDLTEENQENFSGERQLLDRNLNHITYLVSTLHTAMPSFLRDSTTCPGVATGQQTPMIMMAANCSFVVLLLWYRCLLIST